jgi:peptide/nickel transport system substrate-binding protein
MKTYGIVSAFTRGRRLQPPGLARCGPVLAVILMAATVTAALPVSAQDGVPTNSPAVQGRAGDLTFTLPVEPDMLDPNVGSSRYDGVVLSSIFDPLILRSPDGKFLPNLLTSWNVSPDGLTWTLTLRQDVRFQDGTPFDAAALKFNFDRMKDPNTKSQAAGIFLGPYTASTVIDDHTLQMTYSEPDASLLEMMADVWLSPASPTAVQKYGDDFGTNPVGTGPFMFKEWVPKDHITVVRNPDYNWAPPGFHAGPAYLNSITFNFISEEVSRVTALRNGETQVSVYTPPREVEGLKSDGFNIEVHEIPGIAQVDIINAAKPPTDDLAVRKAILYGTNRQAIVDVIDKGVGQPLNDVISPGVWGYDSNVATMYPYDPDKAKQILDDAGWVPGADGVRVKNGQRCDLLWVHFPGRTPGVPELIQGQLKQIGCDMEIQNKENPANMQFARAKGHNLEWMTWGSTDPSILGTLFDSKNAGGGWNYAFYNDPHLDDVLRRIDTTVDQAQRAQLVSEAQQIIMDQALVLPLQVDANVVATSPKVHDLRIGPDGFYQVFFYDTYVDS